MDFFRKCFLENFFLEKSAEGRRQQHGYRTWIFFRRKNYIVWLQIEEFRVWNLGFRI